MRLPPVVAAFGTAQGRLLRWSLILRATGFLAIGVVATALLYFLPSAPTIAVIGATTEFVAYDVVVPELSQIRLDGYSLTYETATEDLKLAPRAAGPSKKPLCLSGLLVPTAGAHMSIRRVGSGPIVIVIEHYGEKPAARFEAPGAPPALSASSWVRLEASTDDDADKGKVACAQTAETRLVIYGPTRIGTPMRPHQAGSETSSGLLISGTVDLFAKTIELRQISEGATKIYPTSISGMPLPPGAQISEYVAKDGTPSAWAGYARPDEENGALDVRVTTPATRIQILRPGSGVQPDVLAANLFVQLTNDPTIVSLQVVAVLAFTAFQTAGAIFARRELRQAEPPK